MTSMKGVLARCVLAALLGLLPWRTALAQEAVDAAAAAQDDAAVASAPGWSADERTPESAAGRQARRSLRKADESMRTGHYRKAAFFARRIIDGDPGPFYEAKARRILGSSFYCRKQYAEAVEQWERIIEAGVLDAAVEYDIYVDLVRAKIRKFDFDEIPGLLRTIEERFLHDAAPMYTDPHHFPPPDKTYLQLAQALWNNGLRQEALPYASAVAGCGSTHEQRAAIIAARALEADGRMDEALAMLRRAAGAGEEGRTKWLCRVYFELIRCALRRKDETAALQYAREGLERLEGTRGFANYVYHVGQIWRRQSMDLWRQYEENVAFSGAENVRVAALDELVSVARRGKDWPSVERYCSRLIALPERHESSRTGDAIHLLQALTAQGKDRRKVVRILQSAAQKASAADDARQLFRIGTAFDRAGLSTDARKIYQQLRRKGLDDPWGSRSQLRLARLLAKQGLHRESLAAYTEFIGYHRAHQHHELVVRGLVQLLKLHEADDRMPVPQGITESIGDSLAAIQDPALLLDLTAFLISRNLAGLAGQCVDRAVILAESPRVKKLVPAKAVALEEKLCRRLYELGRSDEVVARTAVFPKTILTASSVDLKAYADLQYYAAASLWRKGQKAEAQDLFAHVLEAVENDKDLYPEFAVCIANEFCGPDKARARELIEESVRINPANIYSCLGRLRLAVDAYDADDLDTARQHLDAILLNADRNASIAWKRGVYWNAWYLQGVLLKEQGDERGAVMMAEAARFTDIWHQR